MVDDLRNKWYEDLEDLVQCPTCMVIPQNAIYQCIEGHHICQICKPQLNQCPTCTSRWSTSRNRFAEKLCTMLDQIKTALLDPEYELNKLLMPETVSIASQTDEAVPQEPEVTKKKLFDGHYNKSYPCQINACKINKTYDQMMKHLVKDHADLYSELASNGTVFEHSWQFHWAQNMIFERAFQVANMGTFFLKLSTDMFGNFIGYIAMIHNGAIAKSFSYQLEVTCCPEHKCSIFKGEVCSCRTPPAVFQEKSLRIDRTEMTKMLDHEKVLTCTLLLGKKTPTEGPVRVGRQTAVTPRSATHKKGKNLPPRHRSQTDQRCDLSDDELAKEFENRFKAFKPVFNRK